MKASKIFILIFFILTACGQHENWTEFQAKGLPSSGNSYRTLEIVDDNELYLGGRRTENFGTKNGLFNYENYSILYHSTDFGKYWSEVNLNGLKGEIYHIRNVQNEIVVLNRTKQDSTVILKSDDNGKTWRSLFQLPSSHFVSDLHVRQNGIIELNVRTQRNQRLVFKIGSQTVDTLHFQPEIKHLIFSEKGFKGIQVGKKNAMAIVSFDGAGIEIGRKAIETNKAYRSFKGSSDNDLLLYDNYSTSNILIFRNNQLHEVDLSDFDTYKVIEPYVEDSLIVIDGYYKEDAAFLGITHTFLVSHNLGKTWSEEEIPNPIYVSPSDFKKGRFISYAGAGNLQVRK